MLPNKAICKDCRDYTAGNNGCTRIAHGLKCAGDPAEADKPHDAGLAPAPNSALAVQVGGGHYKEMKIQPVEFIHANGIGFLEGSAIKYLSRWRNKNGVEDLRKARHFIDLLIELETAK